MRRRTFITGTTGLASILCGCLRSGSNDSTRTQKKLESLQATEECSREEPVAVLELASASETSNDDAAVKYERFSEKSKAIIDFAVRHSIAVSRDSAQPYQGLISTIDRYGLEPYRESNGERANTIYIVHPTGLQRVSELRVYDQVME